MKLSISLLFILLNYLPCFTQTNDSVIYSSDYQFKEGVYLTYADFKSNHPIAKEQIISSYPKSEIDFFSQVVEQKSITYLNGNGEQNIASKTIWGYCQNRTIYLNFNKQFCRINVIGSLFHFTALISNNMVFRDPMSYNYGVNTTYDELRQFVFDTFSNTVLDFNVKNMEMILQRDSYLNQSFSSLKKKEKSNSIFIYLRKYNEAHPLYLPVN
jgi:hypothetical protein